MRIRSRVGVTLVEMLIAVTIAIIVLASISKAYIGFVKGNVRQQKTSQLQQEVSSIATMLEADGRMAGYGLPGNGIDVVQSNPNTSDSAMIFVNEKSMQTTLTDDADAEAVSIHVASIDGASTHRWVCLNKTGTRVYREIAGVHSGGIVTLETTVGPTAFGEDVTQVYFCDRFMYYLDESTTPKKFMRVINDRPRTVSSMVTTFTVAAKDAASAVLSANYDQARFMGFTVSGGGTGDHDARVISETVQVVIRNFQ